MTENPYNEPYSPVQTSFNASMGTTFRINNLFVRCDEARLRDDLPSWLRALECLLSILDSKLTEKERNDIEVYGIQAARMLHSLSRAMNQDPENQELDDPLTPTYNALDKYQKKISWYMDVHGMLMTNKADPGLAFRGDM